MIHVHVYKKSICSQTQQLNWIGMNFLIAISDVTDFSIEQLLVPYCTRFVHCRTQMLDNL